MKRFLILLPLLANATSYTVPEAHIFNMSPLTEWCGDDPIFCSNIPQSYMISIKNDGSARYHLILTGTALAGVLEVIEQDVNATKYFATNQLVVTDTQLSNMILDVKGYQH